MFVYFVYFIDLFCFVYDVQANFLRTNYLYARVYIFRSFIYFFFFVLFCFGFRSF